MTTESIFPEPAPQIKALVRNLSAFTTLFAPGKSWDNMRSTAGPYTESRLARLVRNKRVGFPVVEQVQYVNMEYLLYFRQYSYVSAVHNQPKVIFHYFLTGLQSS